jgi:arylformamidase
MIHDITPLLSRRIAVWPGDTPLSREVLLECGKPSRMDSKTVSNITLSTLHATVHLGAHADAPSHYGANVPTIDQRSLDYYLGPCQVVRVKASRGQRLMPGDLPRVQAPRLLIATGTFPDPENFNEDFAALSPEVVEALHAQGVKLIGIDTPSVDLFASQDLPAHRMFLKHDMAILEGLLLHDVPPGMYELIALPLKLAGFDASPVRAILRAQGGSEA